MSEKDFEKQPLHKLRHQFSSILLEESKRTKNPNEPSSDPTANQKQENLPQTPTTPETTEALPKNPPSSRKHDSASSRKQDSVKGNNVPEASGTVEAEEEESGAGREVLDFFQKVMNGVKQMIVGAEEVRNLKSRDMTDEERELYQKEVKKK